MSLLEVDMNSYRRWPLAVLACSPRGLNRRAENRGSAEPEGGLLHAPSKAALIVTLAVRRSSLCFSKALAWRLLPGIASNDLPNDSLVEIERAGRANRPASFFSWK
jgi:hypothetical protein